MPDVSKSIDPTTLGYNASTWRVNPTTLDPTYPLAGDLTYAEYQTDPYGAYYLDTNGKPKLATDSNNQVIPAVTLTYSRDFWKYMMAEVFPGVTQAEFDKDLSSTIIDPLNPNQTITKGAYYISIFKGACTDFYKSFFKGRDDTQYTGQLNVPIYDDNTTSKWNTLTEQQKQVIINTYFRTRGVGAATDISAYMGSMGLRYQNILVWVAQLLINMMTTMQSSTINTGRLATRLSQTSQSISTEMGSSAYNYKSVNDPNDYYTQFINQQNTKKLEDLRTYRNIIQGQTDKVSTDLTKQNNDVEQQGDIALKFANTAQQIGDSIFRKK